MGSILIPAEELWTRSEEEWPWILDRLLLVSTNAGDLDLEEIERFPRL